MSFGVKPAASFCGKAGRSGRKPMAVDNEQREWIANLWSHNQSIEALAQKIAKGKYAARDMFALKCLQGNESVLKALANKIIPDQLDVSSGGQPIQFYVPQKGTMEV